MLNEVTDDAVVKVVHLGPRYALAKGDISHRSKSQRTSKVLARPRLPLTHCKKDFRKACPLRDDFSWVQFTTHPSQVGGEFVCVSQGVGRHTGETRAPEGEGEKKPNARRWCGLGGSMTVRCGVGQSSPQCGVEKGPCT